MAGDTTGGTLQTLDRGLRVLELLAAGPGPLPTREIAERLGLHRSIAHRLLRTLQDHGLVARTESGFVLWVGAHLLGRQVLPLLQRLARPEIAHLAHGTGHTAFLTVRSGDEVITLVSVEVANPRVRRISEPGTRHPVDCGAPGLALLACEPPAEGERPEVVEARRRGYALSSGEVVDGLSAVAMALPPVCGVVPGAVAMAFTTDAPSPADLEAMRVAARRIGNLFQANLPPGAPLPYPVGGERSPAAGG